MQAYSHYIRRISKDDNAESTIVSMVILFPLLLTMLITMIEVPLLFSNRNLLQSNLQQGARTVAILGSNGNGGALARTYADSNACSNSADIPGEGSTPILSVYSGDKPLVGEQSIVACETAIAIAQNSGFIAFDVYDVKCSPNLAERIGQPTTCQATYYYSGIPGGTMSLIGGTNQYTIGNEAKDLGEIQKKNAESAAKGGEEDGHGFNSGIIRMSAQSEVCLAEDCKA